MLSVVVSQAHATPTTFMELDGNVVSNGTGTFDWANGSTTNGTEDSTLSRSNGGAAPSTYSRSGSGGVFDGGVFNGNTTPPTSPTKTTTAAGDNTIADAQFKVDPLSVDTAPCVGALTPTVGDPTAYTGAGSETNGDLLTADTYGPGSVPNKDDLSNVYALAHIDATAAHTPPAGDVGVSEVFFGAERVVNSGDSHIDFEFLQGTVGLVSDKDRKGNTLCSGTFSGDRTEGDFLLSVDFTTGGNFGGIQLYRWDCKLPAKGQPYPTQPADGTVCNPPKSGPTPGPHYQPTGTDAVQINVNGHPNNDNSIENNIKCGGWVCRNADGTPNSQILTNELMEGGIDLKQLGFTGCVSTFLPHTRSSQSFTAVLKDFEIIPFSTCAHPTITTNIIANSSGDDVTNTTQAIGTTVHDTATLHNAVGTPTGSISYRLYTAAEAAAGCLTGPGIGIDETPTNPAFVNGVPPASKDVTFDGVGTYYFVAKATFTDNRNLGSPDSGCTMEPITIRPNTVTINTVIKNAAGASVAGTSQAIGTPLHDTATLSGQTAHAGGTVTYTLYTGIGCTGTATDLTPASPGNAVTDGSVPNSATFTFDHAGTFYFKATYSGDANNNASVPVDSGCNAEPITISPNTVTINTVIKNAAGSSVAGTAQVIGTPLHDTATLSGQTAHAGGTVTYTLYTGIGCTGTATDLTPASPGNAVTDGSVPNSTTFTFNQAGTFYFKATYSGDADNNASVPVDSGCNAEPIVISPNTPGYTSTPVVQIKDTFALSGLTYGSSNAATGTVTVSLFTGRDANLNCTNPVSGQSTTFTVTGFVYGTAAHPATVDHPAGTFSGETTFYGPATSGTTYWYRVSYDGDTNNTGFTKCEESVNATITPKS